MSLPRSPRFCIQLHAQDVRSPLRESISLVYAFKYDFTSYLSLRGHWDAKGWKETMNIRTAGFPLTSAITLIRIFIFFHGCIDFQKQDTSGPPSPSRSWADGMSSVLLWLFPFCLLQGLWWVLTPAPLPETVPFGAGTVCPRHQVSGLAHEVGKWRTVCTDLDPVDPVPP